ncbi:MAG: redoxin domain-containing protein [Bacteroidales bacterium]|nr:redoxin domain-containing protein [Bacteroidales bacterium]
MNKRILLLAILALSLISSTYAGGHKIKIKIKGVSDTIVYLGNYYADKKYASDTITLDKNGEGVFQGDEPLKGGIYMVLFPSLGMNYFELLVDDEQEFSLESDTTDFVKSMKVKGSKQNIDFYKFQEYMANQANTSRPLQKRLRELEEGNDSIQIIKDILTENKKNVKKHFEDISETWKGHLLAAIVDAMIEVETPDMVIPESIANKDSAEQMMKYTYYKDHFFDHINLQDDRLIRTPFLAPKIDHFMTTIVVQHPDSVLKEGIKLIESARGTEENFGYLVRYMFGYKDKSKLMGMDKVFVEISEKYYLSGEATWADSSFIEKVRERVMKEKPNLIGNTAPDLQKLETYEKEFVSLHEFNNKYLIVAFWEPNCGHCKKTIPALYKSFQNMKKDGIDVQSLAIYTQVEREPWEKFIEDKELFDWVNAYDKYYFTNFRNKYDIYSTPTLYLLDKDKKIIGKRLAVDQIEKIIYSLEGKELKNPTPAGH